jgi:hypothetical protein
MRLPRLILACSVVAACGDDVDPLDSVSAGTTPGPQTTASTGKPTTSAGATSDATAGGSTTTGDGTGGTSDGPTGTTDDDPATTTTGQQGGLGHDADIQPIWDANCIAFCHTVGGSAEPYLVLDDAYGALVDQPSVSFPALTLVTPGSRNESYLWHKLNGTQLEAGGGGSKMPLGQTLSADDLEKIGEWIDQGALP